MVPCMVSVAPSPFFIVTTFLRKKPVCEGMMPPNFLKKVEDFDVLSSLREKEHGLKETYQAHDEPLTTEKLL